MKITHVSGWKTVRLKLWSNVIKLVRTLLKCPMNKESYTSIQTVNTSAFSSQTKLHINIWITLNLKYCLLRTSVISTKTLCTLYVRVDLKKSAEDHFWICLATRKLHIPPNIWTTKSSEEFKQRQLWGSAADGWICSTWILLWWCWSCLCLPQQQLSLTTTMTWAGWTATARASTSSVPTVRFLLLSGATLVRRMARIACGPLSASPHLRDWVRPVTAGGTTSTVLGWSGGYSVLESHSYSLINTFIGIYLTSSTTWVKWFEHTEYALKEETCITNQQFRQFYFDHLLLVLVTWA